MNLLRALSMSSTLLGSDQTPLESSSQDVQERIRENLDSFLGLPVQATELQAASFNLGAFPNDLGALDRDAAMTAMYAQVQALGLKVYYGLETGLFLSYTDPISGTYREPLNSGYDITAPDMALYFDLCLSQETGEGQSCLMDEGAEYIGCSDDQCSYTPCPVAKTRSICNELGAGESVCRTEEVQCLNYSLMKASGNRRGYIARAYSCIDQSGKFTQEPGHALVAVEGSTTGALTTGDCKFRNGTPVTQVVSGAFQYCGGDGQVCDDTYPGLLRTRDYDPRVRAWYKGARDSLHGIWTEPYTFFTDLRLGITWALPIFSRDNQDEHSVLVGVLGVDYALQTIASFLADEYGSTDMIVAIYESKAPNYIIGTSSNIPLSMKVLASDNSQPCPDGTTEECEVVRRPVTELGDSREALLIKNAHLISTELGFPESRLVSVKASNDVDDDAYVAESILYERDNASVTWRVLIVNPVQRSDTDTITRGDPLLIALCLIAGLGFVGCFVMLVMFYGNRKQRAIIHADYRFTSAFIFFCALLNLASFTLLGENTDALCMLRYWSFFFIASLAISPLLVKIYRIYRLMGNGFGFQKVTITNKQAALYSLIIPSVQFIILLTFTFVDPPKQTEEISLEGGVPVQRIICSQDTSAFFITELVLGILVLFFGCILAYLSRNIDEQFGESKQLIFAIYNLAFTGTIIAAVLALVGISGEGESILLALGVFWGTCMSSAVFVLPRLIQVRRSSVIGRANRNSTTGTRTSTAGMGMTYISGLQNTTTAFDLTNNGVQANRPSNDPSLSDDSSSEPDPMYELSESKTRLSDIDDYSATFDGDAGRYNKESKRARE